MSRRHRAGKPDPSLRTRMRIARDPAKALAQYDDLRVRGRLNSAVILCDMKDGSFEVLSQGMKAPQIGRALMQASAMLMHADADVNAVLTPVVTPSPSATVVFRHGRRGTLTTRTGAGLRLSMLHPSMTMAPAV